MSTLDVLLLTAVALVVISSVGTVASMLEDNYKRNTRDIARQAAGGKIELTMQDFPVRQRQAVLEMLPIKTLNAVAELAAGEESDVSPPTRMR